MPYIASAEDTAAMSTAYRRQELENYRKLVAMFHDNMPIPPSLTKRISELMEEEESK